MYDDVISTPATGPGGDGPESNQPPAPNSNSEETNGTTYQTQGNNITPSTLGRRHQLYVGNLTWVSVPTYVVNCKFLINYIFIMILTLCQSILYNFVALSCIIKSTGNFV